MNLDTALSVWNALDPITSLCECNGPTERALIRRLHELGKPILDVTVAELQELVRLARKDEREYFAAGCQP